MKQRIQTAALVMAITLLTACVTATPYRQAHSQNDYGYQAQKIEQNRYRVVFAGNAQTSRQTVENYLLYRAAELTLEQGKDYFVIIKSATDKNTEQQSTVVGAPSFSLGYGHHHGYGGRHGYGYGFGVSIINTNYNDYQAYGDIVLKSGKKPEDNLHAYNALDVVENLGGFIQRPEVKQ